MFFKTLVCFLLAAIWVLLFGLLLMASYAIQYLPPQGSPGPAIEPEHFRYYNDPESQWSTDGSYSCVIRHCLMQIK